MSIDDEQGFKWENSVRDGCTHGDGDDGTAPEPSARDLATFEEATAYLLHLAYPAEQHGVEAEL